MDQYSLSPAFDAGVNMLVEYTRYQCSPGETRISSLRKAIWCLKREFCGWDVHKAIVSNIRDRHRNQVPGNMFWIQSPLAVNGIPPTTLSLENTTRHYIVRLSS
jgi:hypothetical protein